LSNFKLELWIRALANLRFWTPTGKGAIADSSDQSALEVGDSTFENGDFRPVAMISINMNNRIGKVFGLAIAIGAGALMSHAQQRGSLVASLPNEVTMEFVRIAPGEFMMGCSPGDAQCAADEKPAHLVRITRGFEIGKYEVTEAQWQAIMVATPFVTFKGDGDNHAVGFVGWASAQEFLTKLSARNDGYRYRLPTEAEWEYAARAGTGGPFAGSSLDAMAWYGQNVVTKPSIVGQKQPNAWGLYDTHGNAWEWVQDQYDALYYAGSPTADPKGPPTGQYRVLRGGSGFSDARNARVSVRRFVGASPNTDYYGFRAVREAIR
jgi:formylglycine-generating enzyme required for sulfatase activity